MPIRTLDLKLEQVGRRFRKSPQPARKWAYLGRSEMAARIQVLKTGDSP